MKKNIAIAGLLVSLMGVPMPAGAADGKIVAGSLLIATGGGLMIGAFDYSSECPVGYSTHTFENLPTQCVYLDRYGSDVREQPTSATYARPSSMAAGAVAVATGLVILFLPRKVQKAAPSVVITPTGWSAAKTFKF